MTTHSISMVRMKNLPRKDCNCYCSYCGIHNRSSSSWSLLLFQLWIVYSVFIIQLQQQVLGRLENNNYGSSKTSSMTKRRFGGGVGGRGNVFGMSRPLPSSSFTSIASLSSSTTYSSPPPPSSSMYNLILQQLRGGSSPSPRFPPSVVPSSVGSNSSWRQKQQQQQSGFTPQQYQHDANVDDDVEYRSASETKDMIDAFLTRDSRNSFIGTYDVLRSSIHCGICNK
jgi:hypothetical protein